MATVDDVKEKGFSFIWTIGNFSYCVEKWGHALTSPVFRMNEHDKWCLKLYPKGCFGHDTISVALQNLSQRKEVSYELCISTPIGIFKHEEVQKKVFDMCSEYGFHSILQQKDLNNKRSDTHPKNDSLTVICRIWEVDSEPIASGQCHVRTIIVVERATYIWTIENFVEPTYFKRPTKQPTILSEISSFAMELSSTTGIGMFAKNQIQIEIKHMEPVNMRLFSACEMSLSGVGGKIVHSVRDEHYFEVSESEQIWMLSLIPTFNLFHQKELYLPNGTLSLRCEFAVSSGAKYNEVESTSIGTTDLSKFDYCNQENVINRPQCSSSAKLNQPTNQEKDLNFQDSLKDNLQCFYTEGKFSDLTIRTSNKEFRVHKIILCARSEVFRAMFERDTKENRTGVVQIEDVGDDTVSKMLMFVYTDTVGEDLEFGTASSLYFAAHKYGIVALKRKCSDFLKDNINVSNFCDVLVLADKHKDQEMKSAAQMFFSKHFGEIQKSEEWKEFNDEKSGARYGCFRGGGAPAHLRGPRDGRLLPLGRSLLGAGSGGGRHLSDGAGGLLGRPAPRARHGVRGLPLPDDREGTLAYSEQWLRVLHLRSRQVGRLLGNPLHRQHHHRQTAEAGRVEKSAVFFCPKPENREGGVALPQEANYAQGGVTMISSRQTIVQRQVFAGLCQIA